MRASLRFIPIFLFLTFSAAAQTGGNAPVSARQNYETGRDLEARSRMGEAETYYNEAIRICQDEVSRNAATRETYTVITWVLRRQTKYADVITWGERGLRLYPDEYRIVETMGEAWFYLDDYSRSLSYMQRYTNAVPQGERTSVAYFFIGEIFRITQRYRHADIAYTTAVRLEPAIPLWWFRLGEVRAAAGERAPAMEAFQQALRLNPAYREAIDGLARLQQAQSNTSP
jgi:tetratricopeptide (TPR) repeat protein